MAANADRNLLFGVLALQQDLIDAGQFAEACASWAVRKETPLSEILIERGWISADDRAEVERFLERKLGKHGGDARATLGAVAGADVRAALSRVEDEDVRASIGLAQAGTGYVLLETMVKPPERRSRYTLTCLHAQGALGRVWLARDTELNREVALKEILPEHSQHREAWRRFLQEAQVTGQLEHPNIVPVYELGRRTEDDQPFYTMRFVRGRTLLDAVADYHRRLAEGSADPVERLRLLQAFATICQAIGFAHSRGVVHRDLKPENIVLGGFGEVVVLDWGLAKRVGSPEPDSGAGAGPVTVSEEAGAGATAAGSHLGTPAYMAPEQAAGRLDLIDGRTDIYGLGAVLFEILAGRPPHEGPSASEVLRRIVAGETPRCRSVNPSVAPALDAICARAMAKDRGDRYARASDLADDIQRWLAGEPVSVWREPWRVRAVRWVARHRTGVAAASAAVAAALTLGVAMALWSHRLWSERLARTARAVAAAESEAIHLRAEARASRGDSLARWDEALAAARRAEALILGGAATPATRREVRELLNRLGEERSEAARAAERAAKDRLTVDRLADLHTRRGGEFDSHDPGDDYARAFQADGLEVGWLDPGRVGEAIRARPPGVAEALTAGLDDWAALLRGEPGKAPLRRRLVAAARAADPDPTRRAIRDALLAEDRDERKRRLRALVRSGRPSALPSATLVLLGKGLVDAGDAPAAVDWLREAQRRHPGDVWLNFDLAASLQKVLPPEPEEVIRFYTVARALRPETAHELAHALLNRGRGEEAIAVFRDLVRLRPDIGRHHVCLGRALKDRGRTAEANAAFDAGIAACRRAIARSPEDDVAYNNLARALQSKGDFSAAIAAFRDALRVNPRYTNAMHGLADALMEKGDLGEAETVYDEALAIDPADAEALNCRGRVLHRRGKYDAAIATLRKGIELKPDGAWLHNNLANSLLAKGEYSLAADSARQALRLKPDDADAHNNLGRALERLGDLDGALASYRRAAELDPSDAVYRSNIAGNLNDREDHRGASVAAREALRLKPDYAHAHNELGRAQEGLVDLDDALASYRRAAELDPKSSLYRSNVAGLLNVKGDHSGAAAAAREAIRLDPGNALAHNKLGFALENLGDAPGAVAAYRRASEIAPDTALYHRNLCRLLVTGGEIEGGLAEARRVVALEPEDAEAHLLLGTALLGRQDWDAAAAECRKALALNADLPIAHFCLGTVLQQQGRNAEALAAFRRAHELGSKQPGWSLASAERIRDCEKLVELEEQFPEFARGARKAGGPGDWLTLAQMGYQRGWYATAARFYAEGLAAGEGVEERKAAQGYNAACAAALAASGAGKDEPAADRATRDRLRAQAIDWLRDDLARVAKPLRDEKSAPPERQQALATLRYWRTDRDLAHLRDERARADWPAGQPEACRALWAEVDALVSEKADGAGRP